LQTLHHDAIAARAIGIVLNGSDCAIGAVFDGFGCSGIGLQRGLSFRIVWVVPAVRACGWLIDLAGVPKKGARFVFKAFRSGDAVV
jgi:hypothetical protein